MMVAKKYFNFSNIIKYILTGLLVLRVFFLWFSHHSLYQEKFNPESIKSQYFQSSYIQGDKSPITLSDSELYQAEAYFLVHDKIDLEKLTPGHPPLAKYLIGWSIQLTGSPYIASFIAFVSVLIIFYLITNSIFLTLAITFEPLIINNLTNSLLDVFLLFFHLTAILFFQRFISSKNNPILLLVLTNLFIGFSLSTKFFPVTLPLIIVLAISIVATNNFSVFKKYIISLPTIVIGFVLGHYTYFFYHPSFVLFFKYIRYQINWWAGSPHINPFAVWHLIFQNQWITWWGEGTIHSPDWWIGWPIVFSFALIPPATHRWLWLLVCITLIFLSFQAIFPRHLTVIIPIAYFLTFINLKRVIQGII